jgi:L-rhamnose mutarotase
VGKIMPEGSGRTTIVLDGMMSEIYAKVVFDNKMNEMQKHDIEKQWDEFYEQVKKAIANIEGVPFR